VSETRLRLYHNQFWAIVPLTDKEQEKASKDDPNMVPVETSTGTELRKRVKTKASKAAGSYTDVILPEGWGYFGSEYGDRAGKVNHQELLHFYAAIVDRHAGEDWIEIMAMFPGGDEKLTGLLAGLFSAEVAAWEDGPEPDNTGPKLSTGKPNPRFGPGTTMLMMALAWMVLAATRLQLRTTVGRDFTSDAMFRLAASRPTEAQIVSLAQTGVAAAVGHTALGGSAGNELTADGFARAVAAYAHTASAQTSTLQKTFTHSAAAGAGTARTINFVGVNAQAFGGTIPGAADSGILVFSMAEPSPPTLTGTDSLNQTITFDFGA
jgi:hypothetical protein